MQFARILDVEPRGAEEDGIINAGATGLQAKAGRERTVGVTQGDQMWIICTRAAEPGVEGVQRDGPTLSRIVEERAAPGDEEVVLAFRFGEMGSLALR